MPPILLTMSFANHSQKIQEWQTPDWYTFMTQQTPIPTYKKENCTNIWIWQMYQKVNFLQFRIIQMWSSSLHGLLLLLFELVNSRLDQNKRTCNRHRRMTDDAFCSVQNLLTRQASAYIPFLCCVNRIISNYQIQVWLWKHRVYLSVAIY